MAGQTQQSSLFASMAADVVKATEAHQNDKPDRGNEDLPPGITGVARLRKCEFGVYGPETKTPGKPYFYADAVVVHPTDFTDKAGMKHKVAGRYTKIRISLFATTGEFAKSFDEQWGAMLNELRILNSDHLPDTRAGITPGMSPEQAMGVIDANLRSLMKNLTSAKPFLKFRTYSIAKDQPTQRDGKWFLGKRRGPYPSMEALKEANPYYDRDPQTFHEWQGSTAWDVPNPNGAAAPSSGIGQGPAPLPPPATNRVTTVPVQPAAQQPAQPEPQPQTFDDGAESLDDLVARCGSDTTARPQLLARFEAVGGTREQFENADSWAAIGELIKSRQSEASSEGEGEGESEGEGEGEGEGEPEPEKPWTPEKGQSYPFFPLGKNKQPLKTRITGTVQTVNNTNQTVTLKGSDNKKYSEVAWSRLIRE